jgi:hypothetical protein
MIKNANHIVQQYFHESLFVRVALTLYFFKGMFGGNETLFKFSERLFHFYQTAFYFRQTAFRKTIISNQSLLMPFRFN